MNSTKTPFTLTPTQRNQERWIAWHGGPNPARHERVDVMFSRDEIILDQKSGDFCWLHGSEDTLNIVAYRIAIAIPNGYREIDQRYKENQTIKGALFYDCEDGVWQYGNVPDKSTIAYPWRRIVIPLVDNDPFIELKAAHAQGKPIEVYTGTRWVALCPDPQWDQPLDTYRIKQPTDTFRIKLPMKTNTDPFAELKQAHAQGKQIQVMVCDVWTNVVDQPRWDSPVQDYRIAPAATVACKLRNDIHGFRPLRGGEQWMLADSWKPYHLAVGLRPLLHGEKVKKGDQVVYPSGLIAELTGKHAQQYNKAPAIVQLIRTKRPLPFVLVLTADQIAEGWNIHTGNESPAPGAIVDVRFRWQIERGDTHKNIGGSNRWRWNHSEKGTDIEMYKVLLSNQQVANGWKIHNAAYGRRPDEIKDDDRIDVLLHNRSIAENIAVPQLVWGPLTYTPEFEIVGYRVIKPTKMVLSPDQINEGWQVHECKNTSTCPESAVGKIVDVMLRDNCYVVKGAWSQNLTWHEIPDLPEVEVIAYRIVGSQTLLLTRDDVRCGDEVKSIGGERRQMISVVDQYHVRLLEHGACTYQQLSDEYLIRRRDSNEFVPCNKPG